MSDKIKINSDLIEQIANLIEHNDLKALTDIINDLHIADIAEIIECLTIKQAQFLFNLIEEEKSVEQIIKLGFDADLVKKVAKLLYNSEYKRKQAVIGIKVSKMSFDKDRRYQISNKFCK